METLLKLSPAQSLLLRTAVRRPDGRVILIELKASGPRESHPQPLTERCVSLSTHTAPIKRNHPSSLVASVRKATAAFRQSPQ